VLNKPGKFGAKMFSHYTDIAIFVLGTYSDLNHPVHHHHQRQQQQQHARYSAVKLAGPVCTVVSRSWMQSTVNKLIALSEA